MFNAITVSRFSLFFCFLGMPELKAWSSFILVHWLVRQWLPQWFGVWEVLGIRMMGLMGPTSRTWPQNAVTAQWDWCLGINRIPPGD
jgi:hypothetical protein